MIIEKQKTIKKHITVSGIGLHSGKSVSMKMLPAAIGHGIVFQRIDVNNKNQYIKVSHNSVSDTKLSTTVANADNVFVQTIEHFMAALNATGITNLLIEINAPEVPAMDGSSLLFIQAIKRSGISEQDANIKAIKVLKHIKIETDDENQFISLSPSNGRDFDIAIDFDNAVIGKQSFELSLDEESFVKEVAFARTFGFIEQFDMLKSMGRALGASLNNAIGIDENGNILNKEGLRSATEFARHKLLDAVGDLYVCGTPIIGNLRGAKISHTLNNKILHKLFSDKSNYEIIDYVRNDISDFIPNNVTNEIKRQLSA